VIQMLRRGLSQSVVNLLTIILLSFSVLQQEIASGVRRHADRMHSVASTKATVIELLDANWEDLYLDLPQGLSIRQEWSAKKVNVLFYLIMIPVRVFKATNY
jgi:hypothetical protein